MSIKPSHAPSLRLVNTNASPAANTMPERNARPAPRQGRSAPTGTDPLRELSEQRQRSAPSADLPAADARWVFAVRVAYAIEPGPEPALPPDRRRRLLGIAKALGLRPFDANLIIAIVQDAARSGDPLGASVEERLGLIRPAGRRGASWASLALVVVASAATTAALVVWVASTWALGG
ncbi:MAG: hypothetical protein R3B57_08340 [Phycisphaerales bacterium]